MPMLRAQTRPVRGPSALLALSSLGMLALGAGGCDEAKSAASETEAPEIENDQRPALLAELRERPADFPDNNVRAALAWIDGRPLDAPETSSPDDLRELRFQQNSDVAVRVRF